MKQKTPTQKPSLKLIGIIFIILGSLLLIITSWSEIFFISIITIGAGTALIYIDKQNKK